jgi:bifunctional non-homologous end joining protein LigD
MPLPGFLAPMLATLIDAPFDSERHLFEIKWDGIRALAFVEDGAVRLLSRNRMDLTVAYPELAGLARLPSGTLLDGELVVLGADGSPSFARALERVQARNARRAQALARSAPAQYVLFDLPYLAGASLCRRGLSERRELLQELVADAADPRVAFSDGLVGPGKAFFDEVRTRGLEGLVAKELDSLYLPGKRSRAWLKVKTTRSVPCAIVGWIADERGDLASLVVALEEAGTLVCVGRVGSGLTDALRARLRELCTARARPEPFVACAEDAAWVEPGLFCTVSYLERTRAGLRAPVFVELLEQT